MNVLLCPVTLVDTFFLRDEKVLPDEYPLSDGIAGNT
jgi:hypothetical protein